MENINKLMEIVNTDRATRLHSIKLRVIEIIATRKAPAYYEDSEKHPGIDRDTLLYVYKQTGSCHADMVDDDLLWYVCDQLVSEKYLIKDGNKYIWTGREF